MKVTLESYSQRQNHRAGNTLLDDIAYFARVSNPTSQISGLNNPGLISYLIRNKHWSPFEMAHACLCIETTRAVSRQTGQFPDKFLGTEVLNIKNLAKGTRPPRQTPTGRKRGSKTLKTDKIVWRPTTKALSIGGVTCKTASSPLLLMYTMKRSSAGWQKRSRGPCCPRV